ncbi:MAG: hypothetical protein AB7G93_12600 [Bdellovibrionales bacterium]
MMFMSPLVLAFVRSALLPALGVGLLLFVSGGLKESWRARVQAGILALGFLVGNFLLLNRLNVPPHDVSESYSLVALILAVFVLVQPESFGGRYFVRALFVLAMGALILFPIRGVFEGAAAQRNLIAFFCLSLGVWSIIERAQYKVKAPALVLLPWLTTTALSLFVLLKASASMSQQITVLGAIQGVVLAMALLCPQRLSKFALIPFLSVFVVLLMMSAHFFLDVNPWHLIYLCAPYLLLWIRDWMPFIPVRPLPEAIVLGGASALPLGYFLWGAFQAAGPLY